MIRFSIYRYNSELGTEPAMQDFAVDPSTFKGVMVLDALEALKTQDPTLTFRRSCGEGVCGSDGMNINGKNRLACIQPFGELAQPIVLRPLPGFPVIRDLIVDLEQFYTQLKSVDPFLKNDAAVPATERLQSPEQRAALDGLYECILCACCTSACPSYWWNPEEFVGPAGLLAACRFIVDNRDTSTEDRLKDLEGLYRLFRCRTIMNCADACPKGLNPAQAIGEIRRRMLHKTEV
jgi:succinate dehydrogenase / fumarate reductase iron-sulfur subunit